MYRFVQSQFTRIISSRCKRLSFSLRPDLDDYSRSSLLGSLSTNVNSFELRYFDCWDFRSEYFGSDPKVSWIVQVCCSTWSGIGVVIAAVGADFDFAIKRISSLFLGKAYSSEAPDRKKFKQSFMSKKPFNDPEFINPEPFVPDEIVSSAGRYNSSSLIGLRDLPQLNMGADPILISVNVRQGCRQSNHGGINNANSNKFKRCSNHCIV